LHLFLDIMNAEQGTFMQRCLQLAALAGGEVAPNPLVGAVLVSGGRIIGEGYHQKFGGPHAEVNCLASVRPDDHALIEKSILYVNLEPCSHTGKTPPCAELIIRHHIPEVIIGMVDPNEQVHGHGIKMMQDAGISVHVGLMEEACRSLNRRFITFQEKRRPYIILKWAQSRNVCMAPQDLSPVKITHSGTNRLVHRWRSEEAAIMVGAGTVQSDNPRLTNRLWTGVQPLRVIWDPNLRINKDAKVLDGESPSLVFNLEKNERMHRVEYIRISDQEKFISQILEILYARQINSVLVEGGARLLQFFIDRGCWDEARLITGNIFLEEGLPAPILKLARLEGQIDVEGDRVEFFLKRTAPVNRGG